MNDPNGAAMPAIPGHFVACSDASGSNCGNSFRQNVDRSGSMAGFAREPQAQLRNHGIMPVYPNQDVEYHNFIQNDSDTLQMVFQGIDFGSIPADAQSSRNVIFDVQALELPPIADAYGSTMNESTLLMLQAIEQDRISRRMLQNMSDRGEYRGKMKCEPFSLGQQNVYDNANFYGGFGPTYSLSLCSNPITQPRPAMWSNLNGWFYPGFRSDVETDSSQSHFQGISRAWAHSIIPSTYAHNQSHGILDQRVSEAGVNIGYRGTNINSSQYDPQKRRIYDSNREKNKRKYSEENWKHIRDHHLRRLVQNNHTNEEMAFELDVIHDFPTSAKTLGDKLRKWGPDFKKHPDRRAAQALNRNKKKLSVSCCVFRRKAKANGTNGDRQKTPNEKLGLHVTSSPTLRAYIYQESIFHELDVLLKGCFDKGTKSKGWIPGVSSFTAPQGSLDNSNTWFRLSSQCSGIALLGDAELYDHLIHLFGEVLRLSTTAAQSCDPNMMIHFWVICKSLCHLRFPERRLFILPRVFLRHLRDQFLKSLGNHPLVRFLDSLIRVLDLSPEDFHTTMALAGWKTIHTLTDSCGIPREHRIILNMASRCTKNWRSKFEVCRGFLSSCFKAELQPTDASRSVKPVEKISLLYEYIEAIAKVKYNTHIMEDRVSQQDVIQGALQLWKQSKELCHERAKIRDLNWGKHTQAFMFSAELLAKYHIGCLNEHGKTLSLRHDRNKGFWYVNEAIEILRLGDLQCRIRAFSFSRRLALWLKTYQGRNTAKEERLRRAEILKSIPKADIALPESRRLGSRGGKGNARLAKNRAWWRRRQSMVRDKFETYVSER